MDNQTELYRQIHPNFIRRGEVTSQAFLRTEKDIDGLSVYDGSLIDARRSYLHYTSRGYASCGVLAVTVNDCLEAKLPVESDPDSFPEHALIIIPNVSCGQLRRIAKKLTGIAVSHGWKYGPFVVNLN